MSLGTIWQKRFGDGTDPVDQRALPVCSARRVLMAAGSLAFETRTVTINGELIFAMAWLVLVLSIGAIFLLMYMIREGEMSKVASLFYLVPAVTAVIAWALFGEQLTLVQIAGMALTTFGVGLATARSRLRAAARQPRDARPRLEIAADRGVELAAEDEDRRDDVEEDDRDHDRGEPGIGRHIGREAVEIGGEHRSSPASQAISVKMMPGTMSTKRRLPAGSQTCTAIRPSTMTVEAMTKRHSVMVPR